MTADAKRYELAYFAWSGMAEPCRAILHYLEADWKDVSYSFDQWPGLKDHQPGSGNGEPTLELAESTAIERYLANQGALRGATDAEAVLIDSYRASMTDTLARLSKYRFFLGGDDEQMAELRAGYLKAAEELVKFHERVLARNGGGNGHYVGDRLSVADVTLAIIMGQAETVGLEAPFAAEAAPLMHKVYDAAVAHPRLAAYWADARERFRRESGGYQGGDFDLKKR
ncbi:hypothetical protein HIM_06578 [Hirsutella minnesotensis 3608]|uniref:GST C-terminal domain-containing protein n=1 Tax=Hirsutella minnesotensis 3608 TaxID=1043627 RepID=A0A0F8A4T3_9HYPO|nr:hypothetical protein HIM_06578 [Hirsutella minnesotensis 3608]